MTALEFAKLAFGGLSMAAIFYGFAFAIAVAG